MLLYFPAQTSTSLSNIHHESESCEPMHLLLLKEKGIKRWLGFSLRGKERADYPPSLLNKTAKQKHSLSPYDETTSLAPAQVFCNLGPPAQLLWQVPVHTAGFPPPLPPPAIPQQRDPMSIGLDN